MNDVAMWSIGIVLTILFSIIGFLLNLVKSGFSQLLVRIDKISATLETHNEKLITILSRNEIQSEWLDSHENEIDELKREVNAIKLNCAANNHRKNLKG